MTSQLVRVQETFKDNAEVKIISFTVDPTNDSPEVLDKYAKSHRAISGKWSFLTGTKDSIYTLAKNGFFLSALENTTGPEQFDHAPHFVLVDKKGWIRGYYNGTDEKEVDRLITETKILLKEYESDKH
jgi:protein SCO1/2